MRVLICFCALSILQLNAVLAETLTYKCNPWTNAGLRLKGDVTLTLSGLELEWTNGKLSQTAIMINPDDKLEFNTTDAKRVYLTDDSTAVLFVKRFDGYAEVLRTLVTVRESKQRFVFKIHANMDPKHRDRLAFIKIVSGTFARNVPYLHVRHNKKLKFSSPNAFFADKKEIVDISYPGDIVGLHDTGNFKIGDTLTSGELIHFRGIPSFSPEHFRYINNADPMKAKQLNKGIDQLMDEGVAQLFTLELNGRKVVGTVGALQFDVIQYRLEHEYGASCTYENLNVQKACWVEVKEGGETDFAGFKQTKSKFLAKDKQGQLVFLADSVFSLQMTQSKYSGISFHATSEF